MSAKKNRGADQPDGAMGVRKHLLPFRTKGTVEK